MPTLMMLMLLLLAMPAQGANVQVMADNLENPWALAFMPNGGFLVSERIGRLSCYDRQGNKQTLEGLPDIRVRGQGGLLDVITAKDFAQTKRIYFTYSEPVGQLGRTALAVAKLDCGAGMLRDVTKLYAQEEASGSNVHFGSRVVERDNGELLVTIGDRGQRHLAQDPQRSEGKIMLINPKSQRARVWSMGHRNPQGAGLDLEGKLVAGEHGPQGGDEVNRPKDGGNYGWPLVTYGEEYGGGRIGIGDAAEGLEQPMFHWTPSIAPSGLMIYSGKMFPQWRGHLFTGSLKYDYISKLTPQGTNYGEEMRLFEGEYIRIRDIREAPDGSIWFIAEGEGRIYRWAKDN